MTPTIKELRTVADRTTPGPWYYDFNPNCGGDEPDVLHDKEGGGYSLTESLRELDAKFIATFNPALCLELISKLETAVGVLQEIAEYTDNTHAREALKKIGME